jgi:hypothetical protein
MGLANILKMISDVITAEEPFINGLHGILENCLELVSL